MQQLFGAAFLQRYLVPSLDRVLGKIFRPGLSFTLLDRDWVHLRAKVALWLTDEFVYSVERFSHLVTGSESSWVAILKAVDLALNHFDALRKLDVPHGLFSIPIVGAKTAAMLPFEEVEEDGDEAKIPPDASACSADASGGTSGFGCPCAHRHQYSRLDGAGAAKILGFVAAKKCAKVWSKRIREKKASQAAAKWARKWAEKIGHAAEDEKGDEEKEDEEEELKSVKLGRLEGTRARAKQGEKIVPFLMRAWEENAEVEEVGAQAMGAGGFV